MPLTGYTELARPITPSALNARRVEVLEVREGVTRTHCKPIAPFQNYELAAPGVHAVLKSYDTLGGPTTNGVVFMAKKFRDANPKVTAAVYAAFEEVSAFIRREPRQSAEVYIKMASESAPFREVADRV